MRTSGEIDDARGHASLPRRRRRSAGLIVTWGAIGLVCPALGAFAIAMTLAPNSLVRVQTQVDTGAFSGRLVWAHGIGVDIVTWEVNLTGNALTVSAEDLELALRNGRSPCTLPRWLGWPTQVNPPEGELATLAVGWPFRVLRSGTRPRADGYTRSVWGVIRIDDLPSRYDRVISPLTERPYDIERWPRGTLPVSVLWQGLLANAFVVAASGVALTLGARRLRASFVGWLRRADGRCSACGYSMAGLLWNTEGCAICPECGATCQKSATGPEGGESPLE